MFMKNLLANNVYIYLQVPPSVKVPEASSMELTDENFHNIIDYGLHFVKFYAPWCGHCQKMAGAWEELAQNSQHDKSITISSVLLI